MQRELRTWGGRRHGAGRKPSGPRPGVPHRIRPAHQARHPLHVTLRAREGLPSLREESIFPALRRGLGQASRRGLRLLEFSVQRDHVHLIVEAADRRALSRGLQGLAIRLAKAINRVLDLRGRIWGDRYHARALRTPREVRNALVYVLQNWKKHLSGVRGIDWRSSGPWFNGWASSVRRVMRSAPVVAPQTWLAAVGWRRLGLLRPDHEPSSSRPARRWHQRH